MTGTSDKVGNIRQLSTDVTTRTPASG